MPFSFTTPKKYRDDIRRHCDTIKDAYTKRVGKSSSPDTKNGSREDLPAPKTEQSNKKCDHEEVGQEKNTNRQVQKEAREEKSDDQREENEVREENVAREENEVREENENNEEDSLGDFLTEDDESVGCNISDPKTEQSNGQCEQEEVCKERSANQQEQKEASVKHSSDQGNENVGSEGKDACKCGQNNSGAADSTQPKPRVFRDYKDLGPGVHVLSPSEAAEFIRQSTQPKPRVLRDYKDLGPGVHVLRPREAAEFIQHTFGGSAQTGGMFGGMDEIASAYNGSQFIGSQPGMQFYGSQFIYTDPRAQYPRSHYTQFSGYHFMGNQPNTFSGGSFVPPQTTQFAGEDQFQRTQSMNREPEIRFPGTQFMSREPSVKFPQGNDPDIHFYPSMDSGFEKTTNSQSAHPLPVYNVIPPGSIVSLKDLADSGLRHNGDRGTIVQYSSETKRYFVELENSEETLSVKPENIMQHVHVRIHGLQSQPDLNGQTGLTWISHNKERYNIYIKSLDKIVSLKPENVVLEVGTVARVTGVESRPELNGKWGTITKWIEDGKKYDIQLSANQMYRVKMANTTV